MGVDLGIIDKKGSWFSYNNERLGQGRESVRELLKGNEQMLLAIEKQVHEKIRAASKEPEKASSTASIAPAPNGKQAKVSVAEPVD